MMKARRSLRVLPVSSALFLVSCGGTDTADTPAVADTDVPAESAAPDAQLRPPPGSNEVLRAPLTVAEGLEVIVSDVVIPPDASVPRHYHPGEEFIYVLEGSAVHVQEGQADTTLRAGDTYVIPPRAAHSPRGGPDGARAIVFRVHVEGEEERILVEQ